MIDGIAADLRGIRQRQRFFGYAGECTFQFTGGELPQPCTGQITVCFDEGGAFTPRAEEVLHVRLPETKLGPFSSQALQQWLPEIGPEISFASL